MMRDRIEVLPAGRRAATSSGATFEAAAVLEQTKMVWPSGFASAARSAAIAPLAPGLYLTTTVAP